ncbi:glycosyltransferase family 10 domain-containing protein [Parvibium lacunae]|uniref:Fucosyltransferase C-terminal domain-containing protein n=1 Tax=Parvibium lacunae TaxID=1888893 RepID=A0A368L1G7_9BURK|nr:glycosyltransferase family 10 [Parvibium lacunae]RCS57405.1 hypothetical protein DU000_08050 [Parvibium lacunae]
MPIANQINLAFVATNISNNSIFDLAAAGNRDNCYYPYWYLKCLLEQHRILLQTPDRICSDAAEVWYLDMDVQSHASSKRDFLILLETELLKPQNGVTAKLANYRKIFTWRDDLVDDNRYIKINFPNQLVIPEVGDWRARDKFCCMIAGNKTTAISDPRELYSERVETIRWFEQNAPHDFDLYGMDWDIPAPPTSGVIGKIVLKIYRKTFDLFKINKIYHPFRSYRGPIKQKSSILRKTKFAICYENVCDLPGYITEKIFDCFFSGCIPVYWGADNITDHIPANCFIDRRDFADIQTMYSYLKSINEEKYTTYQQAISDFLQSPASYSFSAEYFAETITKIIVSDIDHV